MDQGDTLKRVPFILITGFLGSGKTSLLKRFIQRYADEQKIAVIQNEFANANVDGQELKELHKTFEILGINKGSVFCVCLLSGFIKSLADLMTTCQPETVILEATGLADPIAIGQLLSAGKLNQKLYLAHVWCVVDSTTFLEMQPQVQRMTHQVRIADTVVLNKTDLVSKERLAEVEERVILLNPHATRIQACYCDLLDTGFQTPFSKHEDIEKIFPEGEAIMSGGPPPITSSVLRTTTPISRKNLERFLRHHEKSSYRIKGYVNLSDQTVVSVQSCFGKTQIKKIKKEPGPTELIALGPLLDDRKFTQMFKEMAE